MSKAHDLNLSNLTTKNILPNANDCPMWMTQRILVSMGKKTWDDFSFEERTSKGWLIPYLLEVDNMFSKRWNYWGRTLEKGSLLKEDIPHIDFCEPANPEVIKMLKSCLEKFVNRGVKLQDFLDWLLWGFGGINERPQIESDVNEFWYRNFNLGPLLKYPHDYFAEILQETKTGYWNNPNAFFATPHNICEMMIMMTLNGEDNRTKNICDPCVGTGRMLLHASNYSLFLSGQDIDLICCKAANINGFLYIPWLVRPGLNHLRNKPEKDKAEQQNGVQKVSPPLKKVERGEKQLLMFD